MQGPGQLDPGDGGCSTASIDLLELELQADTLGCPGTLSRTFQVAPTTGQATVLAVNSALENS